MQLCNQGFLGERVPIAVFSINAQKYFSFQISAPVVPARCNVNNIFLLGLKPALQSNEQNFDRPVKSLIDMDLTVLDISFIRLFLRYESIDSVYDK